MIARYTSGPADPATRGHAFGRDQADAVRLTVSTYERLFAEAHGLAPSDLDRIGSAVADGLSGEVPGLLTEIHGLAAGAGVSPERLVAINARTEILAGAAPPECSVVGVSAPRLAGGPILAQNWDWHPDIAEALVLWTVFDADGTWFTTLTEAGILAKIGVNSRGVGMCINILASSADGGVSGLPVHLLLRLVLEGCADLGAVEDLMRRWRYAASTAVSVATKAGALRSYEISPAGVHAVAHSEGLLLHTNHFLVPPGDLEDICRRDWPDTVTRLEELSRLADHGAPISAEEIKAALRSHDGSCLGVCSHDPDNPNYLERRQTLASILIEPRSRRIEVAEGSPCTAPYDLVGPPTHGAISAR